MVAEVSVTMVEPEAPVEGEAVREAEILGVGVGQAVRDMEWEGEMESVTLGLALALAAMGGEGVVPLESVLAACREGEGERVPASAKEGVEEVDTEVLCVVVTEGEPEKEPGRANVGVEAVCREGVMSMEGEGEEVGQGRGVLLEVALTLELAEAQALGEAA